jgi:ferredoxin
VSHITLRKGYERLADRLNKLPQGAPPSELLYRILQCLFSERDAELVSVLPVRPFTLRKAAGLWKMPEAEAQRLLDSLADRGVILDFLDENGRTTYALPPPMAGFFEFSMMRVRGDLDQKLLAELFHQYVSVEEDFIKALFTGGETQFGRVFVNEEALPPDNAVHVLDYERATEVIKTASHIGVGTCYCRHKKEHVGEVCDAPMQICMTFNSVADSLARHGIARPIDAAECLGLLDEAYGRDLVQFGENVRERVSFICNCCGCCCEAMQAQRRFGVLHPIHTANYLPEVDADRCKGCGRCVVRCPVEAVALVSAHHPHETALKRAKINEEICLGCGVCVRACTEGAMRLKPRPERVITPVNSVHRMVSMAIERGTLQNLLLDNQVALSHRAMAAVLGAILKLPPIKQAMASRQMKSRYLDALLARAK